MPSFQKGCVFRPRKSGQRLSVGTHLRTQRILFAFQARYVSCAGCGAVYYYVFILDSRLSSLILQRLWLLDLEKGITKLSLEQPGHFLIIVQVRGAG